MTIRQEWRGRLVRAAMLPLLVGLAACSDGYQAPAPVFYGDTAATSPQSAYVAPAPIAAPRPMPQRITVRRGQSLGALARLYHVPERRIIAANDLHPPYRLEAGRRLVIPGADGDTIAAAPPPQPEPLAQGDRGVIPLDSPQPLAPQPLTPPRPETAGRLPERLTPPPAAHTASSEPAVIPLNGPLPPDLAHPDSEHPDSEHPDSGHTNAAAEVRADIAAAEAAHESHPPPAHPVPAAPPHGAAAAAHSAQFEWPVHGHILASYGEAGNGTQNDGINIAAARGAPVRAVAAGTVAYVGNQLRGYGNLILVRHAQGWISAYAHCATILVHKGERVGRGQVIAKVGTTGSVSEPQLHFELRRGKQPVDPRDYLAPLPSADSGRTTAG